MLNSSQVYVHPRVSVKALNTFFAALPMGDNEVHTLEIYQHGEKMLRIAVAPYSAEDKREVCSLSKSFTSTAIGFVVDEGRLSVEDRIIDIFPDKLPEKVSENLAKMRVKHVLSMNTGHAGCVMTPMVTGDDAVAAFLAQEVPFEPGTHFAYNTGATCLLSCIVQRITGMRLLEYLNMKLLLPLGIKGVSWNCVPSGQNEGGVGIHVSVDDIVKFALFYLNKGVWNGKRLLSEKWIEDASSFVSDNSGNGHIDWCSGYGYQFWMNSFGGYRGDGAFGQLCMVFPEKDMVLAAQGKVTDMGVEIEAVKELLDHLYDEDDREAELLLPKYIPARSKQKTAGFENAVYLLDENPAGFQSVYFTYDQETTCMHMVLSDGTRQWVIKAGDGVFIENTVTAAYFKPKIIGLMAHAAEEVRFAAAYTAKDGELQFDFRYLNCPYRIPVVVRVQGDTVCLRFEANSIVKGVSELRGKKAHDLRFAVEFHGV